MGERPSRPQHAERDRLRSDIDATGSLELPSGRHEVGDLVKPPILYDCVGVDGDTLLLPKKAGERLRSVEEQTEGGECES